MRGASEIYDKHRLVPFGELSAADIIPFGNNLSGILPPALQQMATSGFTPGPAGTPLILENGQSFLPLICYEALFPKLVRNTVNDADFIVNISIDSWFGEGIGPDQHYAHARYRAIESGRPLVRAANMGHSGVVDVYGREVDQSVYTSTEQVFPVTKIDTFIPEEVYNTTYDRFEDLFAFIIVCFLIMFTLSYARLSS